MSLPIYSCSEPITDPEVLASIDALPTEDDLPCDDGEPMETPRHRDQMNLLIDSLKRHWADRTGYYVGGNMFVHYDPENRRRSRGPDFFLVLNVDDRERKSWVVWREGMRFPDVIIELLSDSTRAEDEGPKKSLYAELFRTSEYYLYDPYSQVFKGYLLHKGRYEEVALDDAGLIYSDMTGLYLGVRDGWLRWITSAGEIVASPMEYAAQSEQLAQEAEQLAQEAEQRAGDAEQLAQEAAQRAGDAEQLAQEAEQRAGDAEQLAQEAEQRAGDAEQLLEAYRRRFGKLD